MPEIIRHNYEALLYRILNRKVVPPTDKDCYQLNSWLQGYAQCQNEIVDLITALKESARDA